MKSSGSSKLVAQNLRSLKGLCTLLILLLVASSSQALETIAHDSHGHDAIVSMEYDLTHSEDTVDKQVREARETKEYKAIHNRFSDQVYYLDSAETQEDECICDEICCIGSIGFGAPLAAGVSPIINSPNERLFDHYQSISLDLLLPPPTT